MGVALLGVILGFLGALALSNLSITMAVPWELKPLPAAKAETQAAQTMLLPVAVSWRLAGQAGFLFLCPEWRSSVR